MLGVESPTEWQRPSVVALLLANLAPLFCVVVLDWEVFPLVFLFWSENLIVGVFNALKMLVVVPVQRTGQWAKLFMIPFFCVHYGMFTFVHGIFVVVLFGGRMGADLGFPGPRMLWERMGEHQVFWPILFLLVSHGVSFVTNFLGNGEYRRTDLAQLMAQPYGRIVVLHLAILGGGFLLLALRSPALGLLLLVVLKTALDLRAHLQERRKYGPTGPE